MASLLALGPIFVAVLARLRALTVLTAKLADANDGNHAVYDQVPQLVPRERRYPYVRVGDGTEAEAPFDALGPRDAQKYGSVVRFSIRVVSRSRTRAEADDLMNDVKGAFDNQPLDVDGYGSVIVACTRTFAVPGELLGGVETRELVSEFEFTVSQRGL